MLLVELMCADDKMHIVNFDEVVEITPCQTGDHKAHTEIKTPVGSLIALKPYDEIRKMLLEEAEDGCFVPYDFNV